MGLGQASPSFVAFATAQGAAYKVFWTIDRVPAIDSLGTGGATLPSDAVHGHVVFDDVHFAYPTRPDVPILRGLSLDVPPGKTLALVVSARARARGRRVVGGHWAA